MASIFKLGKDKAKKGSCYYLEYTDHAGCVRRRKGFTDKGLTNQLAAKLENEAMLRRQGLIDPEQERIASMRDVRLKDHLDDFHAALVAKGSTAVHIRKTVNRIKFIIESGSMLLSQDIDGESVESVLQEMLSEDQIGHRTYNHYVQAMDSFCRWMVPKRMLVNPLAGMARLNTEVDIRHPRRALSPYEVGQLVESARSSGESIQTFDGELRARLYLTSYLTGLRRRELASLTPKSFQLGIEQPILVVQAACSKHRKKDTLPVHPELKALLVDWLPELSENEHLFPKVDRKKTWLMVRKDLERVGIPYRTEEGIADFHAAGRHSYVTGLLTNGVDLAKASQLARHSDVRMTMRYTHIGLSEQAKSLESLPVHTSNTDSPISESDSEWDGVASQQVTHSDTDRRDQDFVSPECKTTCDTECHKSSEIGVSCQKWRRGESNPRPVDS
ncbi:MAG: tyrosine-type recombinase/integrase [Fuerstiella sp.]